MPLLAKIDRLPPFVCRILAREKNGRKPLSYTAIANASGLKRSRVAVIMVRKTWAGVPVGDADRLAAACGVDLSKPYKDIKWLKRYAVVCIRNGTPSQRKMFQRLLATRV